MASIANDRDALLQASTDRTVPVGDVSWDTITGDGRPADNADVTEDAVNAGVTVTSGGMTIQGGGAIKGGQTDFHTGVGFFLGYSGTTYKFSVGNPNGNHIKWDGVTLTLAGSLDFANVVNGPPVNADSTGNAIANSLPVYSGGITFLGGGSIKGGQTDYNIGTGFFLGYSGGYKFSIGNSAGQNLTWNGSTLNIKGLLSGGAIQLGVGNSPRGFAFEVDEWGGVYSDNMHSSLFWAEGSDQTAFGAVVGISHHQTAGIYGTTAIYNAWPSANGVVGENYEDQTRGYVGTGIGYDFYAAGTGQTNFGPFTGAHDALIPKDSVETFEKGNIVIDKTLIRRNGWSNTIFEVELSTTPNQAGAIGIISSRPRNLDKENPPSAFIQNWTRAKPPAGMFGQIKDHPQRNPVPIQEYKQVRQDYKRITVNALGEGQLQVCGEGGNINRGDLIVCSSMPGKGMKQADNIVRSYTVARAREDRNFSGPTDVKTVACIYLCG